MIKKIGIFSAGFITGLAGIGFNYLYKQKKQNYPTPDWFSIYLQNKQLKQSTMYETYMAFIRMKYSFFENQIVDKMNGFNFFKIYTSEDPKFKNNTLYCIFNGNEKLSFHHNTFHGGATTTIIDTLFGYIAVSAEKSLVATAHLNMNFKKPIKCNEFYVAQVHIKSKQGKKIWVQGAIYPLIKSDEQIKPLVTAQGLMISVIWSQDFKRMIDIIFKKQ